jgi:D-serine deaminase-like pyridoxal phosphate-dependent protein
MHCLWMRMSVAMSPHLFPECDTPALLVDLDVLERNLDRMARFLEGTGCSIRPHFKAHRMLEVCRRQAARGARGITCAKLAEAELLAANGFDGLLIANEVAGPHKWRRLAELAGCCDVTVAVDDLEVARRTAAAAREHGSTVGFLIDLNAGMDRCGVEPGPAAVELACRCAELPGLRFRGLMAYEGHVVMLPRAEKEAACRGAVRQLTSTAELCREAGLDVSVVSAGGTGSWDITARCPGVTELQCGTYALMDVLFHEQAGAPFDYACTVLSTVISRPAPERAVTDAGKKALHPSFGMSRPVGLAGAELTALHSEHGLLRLEPEAEGLKVGDQVRFIPYYLEGTVNLYDWTYAVRGGQVLERWKVDGRGLSQ